MNIFHRRGHTSQGSESRIQYRQRTQQTRSHNKNHTKFIDCIFNSRPVRMLHRKTTEKNYFSVVSSINLFKRFCDDAPRNQLNQDQPAPPGSGRESRIQYRQHAPQGYKTKITLNSSAISSTHSLPYASPNFHNSPLMPFTRKPATTSLLRRSKERE